MVNVLVTGARGFVGRNLCAVLRRMESVALYEVDVENSEADLEAALGAADVIYHLAGVNRPKNEEEFQTGNTGSTEAVCAILRRQDRKAKVVLSSSIQAEKDNPYGVSKRNAEAALRRHAEQTGAECVAYRLKNLFGKWCRPNYNSVTATFCHNIARGLPIRISDTAYEIELTYIDDVVDAFLSELAPGPPGFRFAPPLPAETIALGELAEKIQAFRKSRETLTVPDFGSPFNRKLYATYLSYLHEDDFSYGLKIRSDERGSLAEFLKSPAIGQIFISHTRPGVTRGDHYHHTKTEKFMVVQGEAVIRFRHIESGEVIAYNVRGEDYRVLDIPPGYTHSIENVGKEDVVTLFWASEVFDSQRPDTWYDPVIKG